MKKSCKVKILGSDVLVERCDLVEQSLLGQVTYDEDCIKIEIEQRLNNSNFLRTLHHELFEWIMNALRFRYNNSDDNKGDFFFMFDHDKLTTICDVVQGAYEEIKEKLGYGVERPKRKIKRKTKVVDK